MYNDDPDPTAGAKELALKQAWNTVQKDLKCCGVTNSTNWKNATAAGWSPASINKPEGCCMWKKGTDGNAMDISQDDTAVLNCRRTVQTLTDTNKVYYFD